MSLDYKAVREEAGIFDFSSKARWWFKGEDAQDFLNYLITNDLDRIEEGQLLYTPILDEEGEIIDLLIVHKFKRTNKADQFKDKCSDLFLVVGDELNHQASQEWFWKQLDLYKLDRESTDIKMENISEDMGQISIQGPNSRSCIEQIFRIKDIPNDLFFIQADFMRGHFVSGTVHKIIVSAFSHTGESGYDLYGAPDALAQIKKELVEELEIRVCEPASIDQLRVEAGYLSYSRDLNLDVAPYEASMEDLVKLNKEDFVGEPNVLRENKKLLGLHFAPKQEIVPDLSAKLFDAHNNEIGHVTSATFSPKLERVIALAYIDTVSKSYQKYKDPMHEKHDTGEHVDTYIDVFVEIDDKKVKAMLCEPWFYRNIGEEEIQAGIL